LDVEEGGRGVRTMEKGVVDVMVQDSEDSETAVGQMVMEDLTKHSTNASVSFCTE
jgi:hypothetical protein